MAESADQSQQKIIHNDYEDISDNDNEQHTQQYALSSNQTMTDDNQEEEEEDNFSQRLRGADIQIRIDDCMKCYIKIIRPQIKKEENMIEKQEEEEEEEGIGKKALSQEYPYNPPLIATQDVSTKSNEENEADRDINK